MESPDNAPPPLAWSAVLAPIGSPGVDGRLLAAGFELEARTPLALFLDRPGQPSPALVGAVKSVAITGAGTLDAAGTLDVWHTEVANDINRGALVPAFTLAPYEQNAAGHITEGRVCEVRLRPRDQAVWPEASITMLDSLPADVVTMHQRAADPDAMGVAIDVARDTLLDRYGTIDPQQVKAAGAADVWVAAAEQLAAGVDRDALTEQAEALLRRFGITVPGAPLLAATRDALRTPRSNPTPAEQLDRLALVRQLCDSYKDQPPPLFRGPGLSEHGEGYNKGTRDIARAVLSYLDGTIGDEREPSELIAAATDERERRRAVAINAAGRVLAAAGRFVMLSERRQLVDAVLAALDGHTATRPGTVDQAPVRDVRDVHSTHHPQWSQQPGGSGVDSWCGLCHVTLFSPIDGITDAAVAPCLPPPAVPVTGQLAVSPMLPADGWVDVDQASTVCGQVERIGSRFADVDGPGQALVLVRLPDGTPVMGAAALHLFVAGARNLRPRPAGEQ